MNRAAEKRAREAAGRQSPTGVTWLATADLAAVLADLKRKTEALERIAKGACGRPCLPPVECDGCYARATLAPQRKPSKLKREHLCHTTSGDEQVLCDDPACPRSRHYVKRAVRRVAAELDRKYAKKGAKR